MLRMIRAADKKMVVRGKKERKREREKEKKNEKKKCARTDRKIAWKRQNEYTDNVSSRLIYGRAICACT